METYSAWLNKALDARLKFDGTAEILNSSKLGHDYIKNNYMYLFCTLKGNVMFSVLVMDGPVYPHAFMCASLICVITC